MVHGVGGYLELDSDPGFGTTVLMYLPTFPLESNGTSSERHTVLIWHSDQRELHRLVRIMEFLDFHVGTATGLPALLAERDEMLSRERTVDLVVIGASDDSTACSSMQQWRSLEPEIPVLVSFMGDTGSCVGERNESIPAIGYETPFSEIVAVVQRLIGDGD